MTHALLQLLTGVVPAQTGGAWMPEQASTTAAAVDQIFYFILYLSAFFFVSIVGAMVFFVIKYRRRSDADRTSPIEGSTPLEIAWAVIPGLILVGMFVWGFRAYIDLSVPPAEALEVRVTAQRWSWSFDYPNAGITTTNELVIPAGQPVRLTMSSTDVIHSFFVAAFRVKKDVLPNRYTVVWFEATEPGTYDLQCAEYCGTEHSGMLGKVVVKTEAEFRAWLDSGGGMSGEGMSSVEFGEQLFKKQGCATCHSIDGRKKTGPSLLDKFGSEERFGDGSTVIIDDNYIRESMVAPRAKLVIGYAPVMPTYAGRLNDRQINALIDYVKSLSEAGRSALSAAPAAAEDGGVPEEAAQ